MITIFSVNFTSNWWSRVKLKVSFEDFFHLNLIPPYTFQEQSFSNRGKIRVSTWAFFDDNSRDRPGPLLAQLRMAFEQNIKLRKAQEGYQIFTW